jgi:dTDP-4-dehydrorhamnose reductase
MSPRKFLILGANGQVGTELQRSFADAGEVIAWDRRIADLSRPEGLRGFIQQLRPDVILNAAAYTAVDRAESEPELAMTVNGMAPRILAEEASKLNVLLIHYSTDYVFDGTKKSPWVETDKPHPMNVYGKTKLAGERAIEEVGGKYLICRTSWVYGPHGHNFLLTMLRLGRERDQLRVVDDQFGAPTSSMAIADATRAVVERALSSKPEAGIYHLTCRGETTWCGFARAIFERYKPEAGSKLPQVIAIPSSEYPTPARRPVNSVLGDEKTKLTFGVTMPDWMDALDRVFGVLK